MDQASQLLKEHFCIEDGVLQIGGLPATRLVQEFGSPLYVYDPAIFRAKLRLLREALPGFEIHYATKANPTPAVLEFFIAEGCDLDVATTGELALALAAGCPASRLMMAAAGKMEAELVEAVQAGVAEVHVESLDEIAFLSKLATRHDRRIDVGIRLNPEEVPYGDGQAIGGKPAGYGLDGERLEEAAAAIEGAGGLDLTGLHVYFGTQHLDVDLMLAAWIHVLDLARRLCACASGPLRTIDFGGGFGVPYFKGEREFDIAAFGQHLAPHVEAARQVPGLAEAAFVTEPGRYLTADGGLYLARVIACKHSRGKNFVVTDGGINHHLAATGNLGHVIKRNFPFALANRMGEESEFKADIVGRQSTALDTLARKASLPEPRVGDIVAFFQSGAYARTCSPLEFRGQAMPAEVFVESGQARLVRRRSTDQDLLRGTTLDPSF